MTYEQNRVRLAVSLHKANDKELLEFLKNKEFSTYVKKLIREDIRKFLNK